MPPRARAVIMSLGLVSALALAVSPVASGCVFNSADDCLLTLGFGCMTSGSGTGGHAGGTGTGAASASTTGTGGTASCTDTDVSSCPDDIIPEGPCKSLAKKVCAKGMCAVAYDAGLAPSQPYGTCKKRWCDASGFATDEANDQNLYDDGNVCTDEMCTDGVPSQMQLTNTTCVLGAASGFCLADPYNPAVITCTECMPPGQSTCIGTAWCSKGKCVPQHCGNTIKDLGETDVDCGGATSGCLKCGANKACSNGPADCASGLCLQGKCAPVGCDDGVQNGDETAADCGGDTCGKPCADGLHCLAHTDCTSGVCKGNVCQVPTCLDGMRNGDEEGVDCGGVMSACPPCGM
ncbi:Hypothetical protein A7982_12552 [Minicystis rosea]|nr:Hypothetical protein A7982_12552 [Minicystis rosea]